MSNAKKILVIDDSPYMFKAVRRALEPHGFSMVGHAEHGKIGLEMYAEFIPDVVTLDITMPVMDGLETATNLLGRYPGAKIIMLSAMGDDTLVESAKRIGVKHFINKPFEANELLDIVKSVL